MSDENRQQEPNSQVRTATVSPSSITFAPEITRAIKQGKFLAAETERGVIIVGAAMFDSQLENILINFLAPCTTAKDLLSPRGALGSFSARMKACYALGLITLSEYKWLEFVEDLRNMCAHRWDIADFASVLTQLPESRRKQHQDRLKILEVGHPDFPDETGPKNTRIRFERIVAGVMADMLYRPSRVVKERRTIRQLTDWDSAPDDPKA